MLEVIYYITAIVLGLSWGVALTTIWITRKYDVYYKLPYTWECDECGNRLGDEDPGFLANAIDHHKEHHEMEM